MESPYKEIHLKDVEELRCEWEKRQISIPQFIELVNSLCRERVHIWIPRDLLEKLNIYLSEYSEEAIEQTLHVLDGLNSWLPPKQYKCISIQFLIRVNEAARNSQDLKKILISVKSTLLAAGMNANEESIKEFYKRKNEDSGVSLEFLYTNFQAVCGLIIKGNVEEESVKLTEWMLRIFLRAIGRGIFVERSLSLCSGVLTIVKNLEDSTCNLLCILLFLFELVQRIVESGFERVDEMMLFFQRKMNSINRSVILSAVQYIKYELDASQHLSALDYQTDKNSFARILSYLYNVYYRLMKDSSYTHTLSVFALLLVDPVIHERLENDSPIVQTYILQLLSHLLGHVQGECIDSLLVDMNLLKSLLMNLRYYGENSSAIYRQFTKLWDELFSYASGLVGSKESVISGIIYILQFGNEATQLACLKWIKTGDFKESLYTGTIVLAYLQNYILGYIPDYIFVSILIEVDNIVFSDTEINQIFNMCLNSILIQDKQNVIKDVMSRTLMFCSDRSFATFIDILKQKEIDYLIPIAQVLQHAFISNDSQRFKEKILKTPQNFYSMKTIFRNSIIKYAEDEDSHPKVSFLLCELLETVKLLAFKEKDSFNICDVDFPVIVKAFEAHNFTLHIDTYSSVIENLFMILYDEQSCVYQSVSSCLHIKHPECLPLLIHLLISSKYSECSDIYIPEIRKLLQEKINRYVFADYESFYFTLACSYTEGSAHQKEISDLILHSQDPLGISAENLHLVLDLIENSSDDEAIKYLCYRLSDSIQNSLVSLSHCPGLGLIAAQPPSRCFLMCGRTYAPNFLFFPMTSNYFNNERKEISVFLWFKPFENTKRFNLLELHYSNDKIAVEVYCEEGQCGLKLHGEQIHVCSYIENQWNFIGINIKNGVSYTFCVNDQSKCVKMGRKMNFHSVLIGNSFYSHYDYIGLLSEVLILRKALQSDQIDDIKRELFCPTLASRHTVAKLTGKYLVAKWTPQRNTPETYFNTEKARFSCTAITIPHLSDTFISIGGLERLLVIIEKVPFVAKSVLFDFIIDLANTTSFSKMVFPSFFKLLSHVMEGTWAIENLIPKIKSLLYHLLRTYPDGIEDVINSFILNRKFWVGQSDLAEYISLISTLHEYRNDLKLNSIIYYILTTDVLANQIYNDRIIDAIQSLIQTRSIDEKNSLSVMVLDTLFSENREKLLEEARVMVQRHCVSIHLKELVSNLPEDHAKFKRYFEKVFKIDLPQTPAISRHSGSKSIKLEFDLAERKIYDNLHKRQLYSKLKKNIENSKMILANCIPNKLKLKNSLDKLGRRMIKTDYKTEEIIPATSVNINDESIVHTIVLDRSIQESIINVDNFNVEEVPDIELIEEISYKLPGSESFDGPCEMIKIKGTYFGRMVIAKEWISFESTNQVKPYDEFIGSSLDFTQILTKKSWVWYCHDIQEIFPHRYLHRHTAFEIYLQSGETFLFNLFEETSRSHAYSVMKQWKKQEVNVIEYVTRQYINTFTKKWLNRSITNLEYLLALNKLSHRSFNDITQYPVFPWVLSEYSAEILDYNDSSSYREFDYPVGAQEEEIQKSLDDKFNNWLDPDIKAFHFGSHYSSGGIVSYFLLRIQHYQSQAKAIQGGTFDVPDRLFFSMEKSWVSCQRNLGDCKELVPELFYLPDILATQNNQDFGCTQQGVLIQNVELPPWAHGNVYVFTNKHRLVLESTYTTSKLAN